MTSKRGRDAFARSLSGTAEGSRRPRRFTCAAEEGGRRFVPQGRICSTALGSSGSPTKPLPRSLHRRPAPRRLPSHRGKAVLVQGVGPVVSRLDAAVAAPVQ